MARPPSTRGAGGGPSGRMAQKGRFESWPEGSFQPPEETEFVRSTPAATPSRMSRGPIAAGAAPTITTRGPGQAPVAPQPVPKRAAPSSSCPSTRPCVVAHASATPRYFARR
eukprot:scaffold119710_cov63-Phaeocystis_antarctica.AAC.6